MGAFGYLASSYCLFVQNVIKPAVYYVYTPCLRLLGNAGMVMDELTLLGAAIGMIVAGHLADLWGRKKLYGWELLTLIVATIGAAQASEGFRSQHQDGTYDSSTDIYSWLAWWRFVLGLAIGAEHPLVTIITAEWAATEWRGVMLALVFSMLPIARLLAYGVGLAALQISSARNGLPPDLRLEDDANLLTKHVADQVWRWDIGVAVIPAALAVVFRFTIPETPRFYAHIRRNLAKAMQIVFKYRDAVTTPRNSGGPSTTRFPPGIGAAGDDAPARDGAIQSLSSPHHQTNFNTNSKINNANLSARWSRWKGWLSGAKLYLGKTDAGRNLLLISTLCVLSEAAWYCLAKDSHSSMSTFFHDPSSSNFPSSTPSSVEKRSLGPDPTCPEYNAWNSNPSNHNATIYSELSTNSTRFMLVSSIGSLLGSLALVFSINHIHRRTILLVSLSSLSFLFFVSGALLTATYSPGSPDTLHPAADYLFGTMHFFFTFGPRTVVYILAVEMFATEYRGTFYGITAAAGKVMAIAVRPVIGKTSRMERALGIRLLIVGAVLVVAVWVSSMLPLVQGEKKGGDEVHVASEVGKGSAGEGTCSTEKRLAGGLERVGLKSMGGLVNKKLEDISEAPEEAFRRANVSNVNT